MLSKITLFISFIIILFVHATVVTMYRTDEKKLVVSQKPSVSSISVKKVVLKKQEVKKVIEKVELKKIIAPNKIEPKKVKKIVKKAKRKIQKKVIKKVKKEPKKVEKRVEKMVKKMTPKIKPSVAKKVTPIISKEMIVTSATKNMIKNEYLLKLRTKIERNKIYPKRAKRLKQEGKVIVSFEIAKNGEIRSVSLKSGCSYKRLNDAAVKLLEKIAMFEPIPHELEKSSWAIEVPINYSIVNI